MTSPLVRRSMYAAGTLVALALAGALLLGFAIVLVYPKLPPLTALTHYEPHLPLRVYTADGTLIGEFGEKRREVVRLSHVPMNLQLAILAAEDSRFYEHGGVDYLGILRAALADLETGAPRQGASTITMQVARNFFLTDQKTLLRKFSEALLSFEIEHVLTKDQILERYINEIYLGEHAYGFAAAAHTYFDKPLKQLTIAQCAVLAGLPKGPSRYDPAVHLAQAKVRQRYVLSRMRTLGYITEAQYREALVEPLHVQRGHRVFKVNAPYVAEAVRQMMVERFGKRAYISGFNVYTTLHDADQVAADAALRSGVLAYDERHGYRGPERSIALPQERTRRDDAIARALRNVPSVNGLDPAIVVLASPREVIARTKAGKDVRITDAGLLFARHALLAPPRAKIRIGPGSLIRIEQESSGQWAIRQVPLVEAALVALDPANGSIRALCGGFDFDRDQFNHVTQAFRQPGSSFKPFVYSAALEKGFMPATIVDDAPLVIPASYPGGQPWIPHNYENDFLGPITVRRALALSRNVAAARIIEAIGIPYARDYVTHFGFPKSQVPPYPTMVLGAGSFTPLQMAAAYAVFANGGYRVTPFLVDHITDSSGRVIYQTTPAVAGHSAPQVIDPRNAFIMTSMLKDVIRDGTAVRAKAMNRRDIAGKTGTSEHFVDAWFDGYTPKRVAVAWMGFDQPRSLGHGEAGARAALPMWIDYMSAVLKGVPDLPYVPPPGVVPVRADPTDGLPVAPGEPGKVYYFYQEDVPTQPASTSASSVTAPGASGVSMPAANTASAPAASTRAGLP